MPQVRPGQVLPLPSPPVRRGRWRKPPPSQDLHAADGRCLTLAGNSPHHGKAMSCGHLLHDIHRSVSSNNYHMSTRSPTCVPVIFARDCCPTTLCILIRSTMSACPSMHALPVTARSFVTTIASTQCRPSLWVQQAGRAERRQDSGDARRPVHLWSAEVRT